MTKKVVLLISLLGLIWLYRGGSVNAACDPAECGSGLPACGSGWRCLAKCCVSNDPERGFRPPDETSPTPTPAPDGGCGIGWCGYCWSDCPTGGGGDTGTPGGGGDTGGGGGGDTGGGGSGGGGGGGGPPPCNSNNWGGWSCGTCSNPGGCGNVTLTQSCSRTNECGDSQSQTQGCGSACNECGPRYGSWSSCSQPSYQRSRTVGYDCQVDTSQAETCSGAISGTIFNSVVGSCGNPTEGATGVTMSVAASGTAPAGCSLSGSSVTDGSGNYSIANLCSPATYLMTINSNGIFIDEPDSYCDGGLSATLTSQGQTVDKDFGLTKIYDGWVQVDDGDVYAAGRILNYIPPSCTGACVAKFLLDGAGGDPGVVGYGGSSANFGKGEVSSTNWLVNAPYGGKRYGFEFWRTHWDVSNQADADWTEVELLTSASKPTSPPIHPKVYYANGDMIIADSTWQIANGEKIAVLVRGNLDIKAKISVAEGGFLAFVVRGDIKIDPSINSEDGQGAVEGIYMADGEIDTGTAATKLILEGTFVGWQGVTLGRDFATVRNNTEPVEVFVYRPDIIAASPQFMKRPSLSWQEVAP